MFFKVLLKRNFCIWVFHLEIKFKAYKKQLWSFFWFALPAKGCNGPSNSADWVSNWPPSRRGQNGPVTSLVVYIAWSPWVKSLWNMESNTNNWKERGRKSLLENIALPEHLETWVVKTTQQWKAGAFPCICFLRTKAFAKSGFVSCSDTAQIGSQVKHRPSVQFILNRPASHNDSTLILAREIIR